MLKHQMKFASIMSLVVLGAMVGCSSKSGSEGTQKTANGPTEQITLAVGGMT